MPSCPFTLCCYLHSSVYQHSSSDDITKLHTDSEDYLFTHNQKTRKKSQIKCIVLISILQTNRQEINKFIVFISKVLKAATTYTTNAAPKATSHTGTSQLAVQGRPNKESSKHQRKPPRQKRTSHPDIQLSNYGLMHMVITRDVTQQTKRFPQGSFILGQIEPIFLLIGRTLLTK